MFRSKSRHFPFSYLRALLRFVFKKSLPYFRLINFRLFVPGQADAEAADGSIRRENFFHGSVRKSPTPKSARPRRLCLFHVFQYL